MPVTTGGGAEQQFSRAFREEARELLVELESVLLELNEHREDGELVGRVFRGLHTIKGSGAMFGFEDLATFTHNLENAFDEVRKGRLEVTPALVDLTLCALDQIRAMVEEGEGESAVDAAACTEILARLRALTGIAENAASQPAPPAEARAGGEDACEQVWRIHFAPGPDLLRNGADPLLLVRELAEMGRLTAEASMAGIPPLEALEPERCYVSWEMVLATTASEDRIRDVFIFVEDICELTIAPVPREPAPSAWQRRGRRSRKRRPRRSRLALATSSPGGSMKSARVREDGPPISRITLRVCACRRREARPVCRSGGRAGDGAGAA
jgi:two-component system chemotaxis sensor kinase CheA